MVAAGEFREDLWFRINTFEITLPPLAASGSTTSCRWPGTSWPARGRNWAADDELFSPETAEALRQHNWPGNVRELANVVEHALILCDEGPVRPEHLPQRFLPSAASGDTFPTAKGRLPAAPTLAKTPATYSLRELELQAIQEAVDRRAGNKSKAADDLGISLKTLYNKLSQAASLEKSA